MILGFDLDEVVVNLTAEFEKYLDLNYGIEWPPECFISYNFDECMFDNDEEFNKRIRKDLLERAYDPEFQSYAEPVEGAQEVLQKLRRLGHKLYFISARSKQNQPATFKWLRNNNIPFDKLYLIGNSEQKGVYGMRHDLDMYVDDLEKHLESMWAYKKRWRKGLLLFDRPWNRFSIDGSKFQRIKNWKEILRHVGIQNR